MKRRWFLLIGLFLIISNIVVVVAFGFPPPSEPAIATLITSFFAGILLTLGGSGRQFWGIKWYQFVGAGQIFVGLLFVPTILLPILTDTSAYESSIQPFLAVGAAIGGALIIFIGFDWIRGGQYFEGGDFSNY